MVFGIMAPGLHGPRRAAAQVRSNGLAPPGAPPLAVGAAVLDLP